MYRVAITDYNFPDFTCYQEELSEFPVELLTPEDSSPDAFLAIARNADAVIHMHLFLTEEIIASLERCRVISHHGKGVDNIAVDAATERGILVANVLGASQHEVAEHLIALLFSVARRIPTYHAQVQASNWHVDVGAPLFRLHGKTLGLVGFGALAKQVARKARALGLELIAYARRPSPSDAEEYGVTFVDLPTVFETADAVSIHVPSTQETERLVSRDLLNRMKQTAIFLNISRGAIVDEVALADALREKRIFGAGLDVLTQEPPAPDNPLLHLDNVIITPHCAWYSEEARDDVERRTAQAVARVFAGEWPISLVNPEVKSNFQKRWLGE